MSIGAAVEVNSLQDQHNHPGQWRIPTAVGVLLILLCAAGGVWGIWRWIAKSTVNTEAVAVDAPTRGQGFGRRGQDQPQGRILKRDDGSIRAFSGNYSLYVTSANRQMTLYCGSGEQWLSKD